MLPFLKKERPNSAGMSMEYRKPDEGKEEDEGSAIDACSKDILRAISSNDYKQLSAALKAAFDIMDSLPHEEGPHTNEE